MQITIEQLKALGATTKNATNFVQAINDTLTKYQINTPLRVQHFLAQIFHESARLFYVEELASGSAYDVGKLAVNLGNTPADDGDGERLKGRGLIQITGTTNYKAVGKALGIDFFKNPDLLEQPKFAALSAGWYWDKRGLNQFADKDDIKTITKKINGGFNGLDDRQALLIKAKQVIK